MFPAGSAGTFPFMILTRVAPRTPIFGSFSEFFNTPVKILNPVPDILLSSFIVEEVWGSFNIVRKLQ
jgi:hypothetical protein